MPPPPPPPSLGSGRGLVGRFGAVLAVVLGLVVLVGFTGINAWLTFSFSRDDEGYVYTRYNDALVAGDWAGAWGMGCRSDRDRIDLDAFEDLVDQAVQPLGGLDSWGRLRGGAEWHGPDGTQKRRPDVDDTDGQACIHFGDNPLGEPF
jgi:hypothetical protein